MPTVLDFAFATANGVILMLTDLRAWGVSAQAKNPHIDTITMLFVRCAEKDASELTAI